MAKLTFPNGTLIPVGIRVLKAKGETSATQRDEIHRESPGAVCNLYLDVSGEDAVTAMRETVSGGYLRLRQVIEGMDSNDPVDALKLEEFRTQSAGQYADLADRNDTGFPLVVYKLEDLDGLKIRHTPAQILAKIEASPFALMLGALEGQARIDKAQEIAQAMKEFRG